MIPCYRLDLLTLHPRQECRVWRDVWTVCLMGWLAFLLVVMGGL